jgi:hypothetical protein
MLNQLIEVFNYGAAEVKNKLSAVKSQSVNKSTKLSQTGTFMKINFHINLL